MFAFAFDARQQRADSMRCAVFRVHNPRDRQIIREDFPVEALKEALLAFARGRGSSIMTITCADPNT
jgi:hypothetical protein